MAIFVPSLKVGAWAGAAGVLAGAAAGIMRSAPPKLFSLVTGAQWFTLGFGYYGSRLVAFKVMGADTQPLSSSQKIRVSALAGGVAGILGGLLRGPRNILPGFVFCELNAIAAEAEKNPNSHLLETRDSRRTGADDAEVDSTFEQRFGGAGVKHGEDLATNAGYTQDSVKTNVSLSPRPCHQDRACGTLLPMAVPTFLLGLLVLTYLSSFVVFAILRIVTGISIQRIGYFSLRRIAYTPCDGFKMEIRGLGLNVHRPTFAQPTWLSIRVNELAVILDVAKLEASRADGENSGQSVVHDANGNASEPGSSNQDAKAPTFQCEAAGGGRSKTWKHLTMMKDKIKRLHRKLNWLRLVDVVAANSTLSMPGVGNIQVGSLTMAIDTRRKMINRARFFSPSRADGQHQRDQAEWIISMRSVLFTVEGGDSLEILDTATLNIHGFLYEALDGLRDASVALKLGRVHIPYDDVVRSVAQYKSLKSAMGNTTDDLKLAEATADKVMQELDVPGSTNHDLMQAVSDSKEFISSILRGIKEVQLAVSYVDLTKKVEGIKTTGPPILFNASMKEVGIDLHRLDPRSPAHRMYFPSKDIAHEALAAALSISVGSRDLIAVDFKATLIQIKADMPTEPPLMLQIYNMEVGRHRWSSPFVHAKLIRLYAEAPRMRRGVQEERLYDLAAEGIRIAVPHEMIVHKISDNVMNMLKAVKQLHHRFKTGTNEYILDKGPEGPTNVPRLSLRIRMLMFEFEDGAFEWKLGVIYRAGRLEQMQRQAREEAFRVKVKRLHEEENGMKEDRAAFWGRDEIPDDMHDSEQILEVPHRPALMSTVIQDLHLIIDRPSFPLRELPEFMHKVGKGMPRDMQYSLLVPMNVQITMGEAKVTLRDYPLPLLHVPSLRQGQASRLAALSLKTDFVLAEEFRGLGSTRRARVQIIPPTNAGVSNEGAFAIDVRRTIGPVKSYSDMSIDINSANPTRFTWGPCYQPAIQDMMTAIESLTKPQIDPSERVGFWDKIRLTFHSCVRVAWRGDGDVHLALKGTRDPYHVTGNGAGFLMCWRNDVRWSVHSDDDPKRFMSVDSGEYVLAIPDYGREARKSKRQDGDHDGSISDSAPTSSAAFKKVVMKLSGKVQWLAGLVFERAIEQGDRNFEFKPHYEVVTKSPAYAKPAADLPYDAFRGFRSQHIHLSVAVRAPVDREWSSDNTAASRSYNAVHVTPRFFTHFFAWWSLFSGPMSLPIRQGALWPGRERNSKKFGRHLATIKYNLLLAPLFLSHIYKHKDTEDSSDNAVSATGIKVRFDSWMLDLHQRREEFNTRDRGRKTQSRTSGMKIHAAQLDLVSADIRAVSARIRGITTEAIRRNSISTFMTDQMDDGADLSHFTIPDHDFSWIDMDDFVELDWILPTEPNPDTKILPLVYAPRITYFRQTDIGGVIDGDPDRRSPFGQEATHRCIMSHDDNPEKVQAPLIRDRLAKIDEQMARNKKDMGDLELQIVRGDRTSGTARAELDTFKRYGSVLAVKKTFMEAMLRQMASRSTAEARGEPVTDSEDMSEPATDADKDETAVPAGTEFANDFKNRFVVHNMQLKWNNTLRNIILRYIHQVSQRRGFVYYLSRPAVKFILDIVEEQTRLKTAKNTSSGTRAGSAKTPEVMGSDRESQKDIEDRIRKILQEGKKYVNADDAQGTGDGDPTPVAMDDLSSGIAEGFTPQNSYHVRLIAPQIQLQSDKNKKHVVLITAKGMELKVVEVMDKERISDSVSGLVQRRFLVGMDSTQFFVTHQKWFTTQLVSLYAGSNYGTPHDSSWPPWVPMEVMFDFQTDPFGFKRVVQKTSATLRYEKYNTLRLKYNDEVNTGEGSHATAHDSAETRMDNLWVDFPQARALCNSSQYYAIYVIVLDLLMFSEPLEKTRSERLEKIKLASDFSDLRGAPEMVIKLQERIRQLEEIKTHFQVHSKYMDKKGWQDRLVLERDLAACEDELFFMMKAITTSQRKIDGTTGSSALLRWSITAKEIVWHLIRDSSEPLVELQLKNVEYDRTDNADGSHINLIQVGSVLGLNLLPDAIYPAMIAPYSENEKAGFELGKQPMIRVYWYMLEAIAGIPVMDHFEVNLFPMKIQLEREVGKKLFEYIFPGIEGDKPSESPLIIGQSLTGADADGDGDSLSEARDVDKERDKRGPLRPGSLDLRLRPTLTSEPKTGLGKSKALSVHSGDGASGFRLFRSGTGSKSLGNRKPSAESLRRSSKDTQPGLGRSSSGPSLKEAESHDSRRGARFGLNRSKGNNGTDDKTEPCDDLTKMIDRASNYMTFAYIKLPSVVLCLSYKGKGDRNLEDVHDFVFRLPTIEFRNKTWSNLDLALALKSRVIKALISHTGAIIGNKFSRHRPNTAQQSRLRELATSSVLLSSSTIPPSNSASQNPVPLMPSTDAHEHSDDSSSLFSSSTLDFSRSPPRASNRSANALSHRGSGSSIPAPTLASRESSAASTRSHLSTAAHVPHGQAQVKTQAPSAVPAFLMMTRPPTPRDRSTPSFAEFGSRGGDSRDGSSDPSIKRSSNGAPIPSGGSGADPSRTVGKADAKVREEFVWLRRLAPYNECCYDKSAWPI
ncbi:hypothetical protein P8C59_000445 [Phyllachora maydis]|uniref:Uncharacterized protein n=1 Tax=Phyllachora maydis TaxID=1825666 RepID=A0AAD9HW37_9PEZI|nr:hypothetical protein P8C59_000445 [Phyllachora maydis]